MARARKKPAKARPKTKQRPSRKPASVKAAPRKRATPAKRAKPPVKPKRRKLPEAVPVEIAATPSTESAPRRAPTARERAGRASPVVEILDDRDPIAALRRFLDSIKGLPTVQQGQIALGSAQLMLLPIARESRGGTEVKDLLDMLLERWPDFPEPAGFHAQEFLRNALAAVGVDRERIAKLEALVPAEASGELLFNLACAHAVARDKVAMLRAVEQALEAGVAASQFRREGDFAPYRADPDLAVILARADVPAIPVDVDPYLRPVRGALDSLVGTLREFGERVELRPPVRLDTILDAERASRISLPNDFRALLTITNGMRLWDHDFFGVGDFREPTPLAVRARQYLDMRAGADLAGDSSHDPAAGLADCIPIASWGQPNDWLFYDPRGATRGGVPGYIVMTSTGEAALDDLASVFAWLEQLARDVLGTN